MPGPAPKPTHLKLVEGNRGKRPINKDEPQPTPTAPAPPAFLKKEALEEWNRLAPELERLGLLTIVDGSALAAYCQAYRRWIQAERKINREGMVLNAKSRYSQAHPAMAISQKERQLMKAFATEFGLTPASRTRIAAPKPSKKEDPMEGFID